MGIVIGIFTPFALQFVLVFLHITSPYELSESVGVVNFIELKGSKCSLSTSSILYKDDQGWWNNCCGKLVLPILLYRIEEHDIHPKRTYPTIESQSLRLSDIHPKRTYPTIESQSLRLSADEYSVLYSTWNLCRIRGPKVLYKIESVDTG